MMVGGREPTGRVAFDANVLEAIQAAVVITDLDGIIVAANSRAQQFYGRGGAELVGSDSMILRAGPIPDEVIAEVGDAIMSGRSWEGEFTVQRADGTAVGIHVIDTPAFDDDGHLIGIVAIGFDVTEYRLGRDDFSRVLAGSRILRGLVDSLSAEGPTERIEHLLADAARRVTAATSAQYLSVAPATPGQAVVEAVIGDDIEHTPGQVLVPGNTALVAFFARPDPVVVADLDADEWRTSSICDLVGGRLRSSGSLIVMAVRSRSGAGSGLMVLGHPERNHFTDTDIRALTSVCVQAGVAIDLARMFRTAEVELATRQRAEEAQRFLAAASETLASALDTPEMFKEVARVCVPFLADYCTIDLAEPGGRTRRVATVHSDPAFADITAEIHEHFRTAPTGTPAAVAVAHGGVGSVLADVPEEFLTGGSTGRQDLVGRLGFTSAMCVPLRARGRVLGALTLVSAGSGRWFGAEDLAIAEDFGRRAALAVDNARLYAERDHTARVLQAGLLPRTLPEIPGAEVAARYLAAGPRAEVGGDFYDAFLTEGDAAWILIGDVSGKGPEAAAVVGLARHTLRALGRRETSPRRLLADLHEALLLEGRGEYCTVCCARLVRDGDGRAELTVASGGHPPPIIRRADGRTKRAACSGTLLGMPLDVRFEEEVLRLGPGDTVVFHTDGVTEERNDDGEELGDIRLAMTVRRAGRGAAEIADRIVETVREHGSGTPRDDVAVVVVGIKEES